MTNEWVDVPQIPEEEKLAQLTEWHVAKQEALACKPITDRELMLRKQLLRVFFPNPKEGANVCPLPNDCKLTITAPLTRSIDKEGLIELNDELVAMGIDIIGLIEYEPKLKVSAYRELSTEQRNLFDRCLVVKDGAPTIEIKEPK